MFVVFSSCEKDDFFNKPSQPPTEYKVSTVDWGSIRENAEVSKKIGYLMNSANLAGRGGINDTLRIEIDSTYARYVESTDGTYHSYTFRVTTPSEQYPFRNLLFSLAPNGEYHVFLVNFDLTPAEVDLVESGLPVPNIMEKMELLSVEILPGNFEVTSWGAAGCVPIETIIIPGSSCDGEDHHSYGDPGCPLIGTSQQATPAIVIVIINDCDMDGSSTYYVENPPSSTNPINYGSGISGGIVTTGPVHKPVSVVYLSIITNCITPSLEAMAWLNADADDDGNLDNFLAMRALSVFLSNNACSAEASAFATLAAEALAGGGKVDYDYGLIIDASVEQCVQDIIYKMKEDIPSLGMIPSLPTTMNLAPFILNTFNDSKNHDLIIKQADLPPNAQGQEVNAKTSPVAPIPGSGSTCFTYTITLNNDFVDNATDLAIASTIIHEALHAYISYIYQTQIFSDFAQAYTYHVQQFSGNSNQAQHQYMLEFADAMAMSLQIWDNNSLGATPEYYLYLSYSGAHDDNSFFSRFG